MKIFFIIALLLVVGTDCKKKKKTKYQDRDTDIRLSYYLYRRSNRNGIQLIKEKLPSDFDRSLLTYVVLHGMGSNYNTVCQRTIRNSILDRTESNIITPNYTNSSSLYTVLYQEISRQVGNFLKREKINPSNTIMVGASLGAHIAGVMRRRTGFRPRDIFALDPAGPVFDQLPDAQRLNPNSAQYVQAYHTNAGYLGAVSALGNDDVYINGGNDYPCCTSHVCRHAGACDFFIRSIVNGPFQARQCEAVEQARSSSCRGPVTTVGFGSSRQSGRRVLHLQLRQCS